MSTAEATSICVSKVGFKMEMVVCSPAINQLSVSALFELRIIVAESDWLYRSVLEWNAIIPLLYHFYTPNKTIKTLRWLHTYLLLKREKIAYNK